MILSTIKTKLKEWVSKLFNKSTIESKINVDIAVSNDMANAIDRWRLIHENKSPWVDKKTVFSMNLGQGIATIFAKLVTIEIKSEIKNNEFLNEEYQVVIDNIRNYTQFACALGGLAFKPYVSNGHIEVDLVQADSFYPTAYNSRGDITGCVFIETKTIGEHIYSRLEYHNLVGTDYTIMNKAFKKSSVNGMNNSMNNTLGEEIQLTEVQEWSELEPIGMIQDVERPLFSYFKMPMANTIDSSSPLGVSVFAPIEDDILKKADEQYSRIDWEYKGSELAIDADVDMFKKDSQGNPILPTGKERLYRALDIASEHTNKWNIFSPNIRDISLYNGLQHQLRMIEFQVGLAYGTISDPNTTDKTAEEIRSSKQNSFQTVSDMQKAQKNALKGLVYAMSVIGMIYKLPVKPVNVAKDIEFNYGDSIMTDKDEVLSGMAADVASGILKAEIYLAKKYGVSEEEALKMMPNTDTLITNNPLDSNIDPVTGLPMDNSKSGDIVDDAEEVANKQLNGAQTQSLVAILAQYAAKQLTLGQAINVIAVAIGISKEDAKKIINGTD